MLTLDDCKMVMEHVDGLVVVDEKARILFMNRRLSEFVGVDPEAVQGAYIKDVIPTTKIHLTVETGEPAVADFYFVKGMTIVSTRYPLYKNNKLVGAVEYDVFENYQILKDFLKKAESIYNEFSYYKQELKRGQGRRYSIENIVGESQAMKRLRGEIRNAAASNSTVLITGETGTGKELVAQSIHALSERSKGNFISVNCSAIPFELFESELFGFEEGSFTNARKGGKTGKFELANLGTLFLDEINQLPVPLQPKILRALQEKEIDRIGGKHSVPVDARVICATNQDLKELVRKGLFREDLFFRLNVIEIQVPPLRERKEDIPCLVYASLEHLNHFLGRTAVQVSDEVFRALQEYDWPGNIRELQNVLERVLNGLDASVHRLEIKHFARFIEEYLSPSRKIMIPPKGNPLEEIKRQAEREAILQALRLCNGNRSKAAELLRIPRPLLYQKMKRLQVDPREAGDQS